MTGVWGSWGGRVVAACAATAVLGVAASTVNAQTPPPDPWPILPVPNIEAIGQPTPRPAAPVVPSVPAAATQPAAPVPAGRVAYTRTLPLWEFGIGGVVASTPHYPAASQNGLNAAPFPVIIYRGDFLRLGDGDVARGRIVKTDRYEFDISFDGSFPASSDDNDARAGMPDLDFLVELGPTLKVLLAKAARDAKIELSVPLRAAFSTDVTSIDYQGLVFNPKLKYKNDNFYGDDYRFSASIGPAFTTSELQEYFYQVDPQFATASRPAYQADAGYLGTRINVGFGMPVYDRVRAFVGGSLGYYGGAANEDSPLFRDEVNFAGGIGLTWSFYHSDERVPDDN